MVYITHTSGSHLPAGQSMLFGGKQVRSEDECESHAVVTCIVTLFRALLPFGCLGNKTTTVLILFIKVKCTVCQ